VANACYNLGKAPVLKPGQSGRDAGVVAPQPASPSIGVALEAGDARQAVFNEFSARFGSRQPLALTETVAFHLKADAGQLFSQPAGSLLFSQAVARCDQFDRHRFRSLADYFGVSVSAMAIRLQELNLVASYI
jgi:hypothetical protein